MGSFDGAIFSRPPGNEIENGGQIDVNGVPIPAGLALLPRISHPQQILLQRLLCIGNSTIDNGEPGSIEVERPRVITSGQYSSCYSILQELLGPHMDPTLHFICPRAGRDTDQIEMHRR